MAKYARWTNDQARGNRTGSITISTTLALNGGTINNFIDGGFANNFTDSVEITAGQSTKEIKFVFGVAKMITGFVRYYSSGADTSTWKLQGSADDITYVDITGAGAPLGSVGNVYYLRQNSTGVNDGYYLYYKLVQTSGTTSSSPYQQEIEFLLVDSGTTDDQAAIAPSYGSFQGSGDRRAYIIMTGDVAFTAEKTRILDGTAGDTTFFNSGQSGKYLELDFGTEVLITEFTWTQDSSGSHGTWKWQKDTGGGTWVDVGSTFTLGGSTSLVVTAMSGETNYYKKYRLQQVSGTTSSGPFIRELTFKLGYPAIAADGITLVAPTTGPDVGGTAVTLTGTGFTTATNVTFDGVSATGITVVSDTSITCTTPAGTAGPADIVVVRPSTNLTYAAGFTYIASGSSDYVSQTAVLVIDNPNQPVRITETALLVVNLPVQDVRLTQVSALAVMEPKSVPLPFPIVPEVPVKEVWQYRTVVNIAEKGKEQRAALRSNPRVLMSFQALLLDDLDRKHAYAMLIRYSPTTFYYPLYQYSARLTVAAVSGASKLFCDPLDTDIRVGEAIALFNPLLDKTVMLTVSSIDIDGIVLAAPLEFDVPVYWGICPAIEFRLDGNHGLRMNAIDGDFNLQLISKGLRNPIRPGAPTATLTLLGGLLLLDNRPSANTSVDEAFNQDVNWLDVGSNDPQAAYSYFMPYIGGSRTYQLDRLTQLDYWRTVADYLGGRLKPFYVPTFRNDLPLSEVPLVGATTIKSTNVDFFNYWRSPTHRFIRWQSGSTIGYSLVNEVTMNYDVLGNPETVDIKLASAITANVDLLISFVNTCRLDADDFVIEHGDHSSEITFKIRTVDA